MRRQSIALSIGFLLTVLLGAGCSGTDGGTDGTTTSDGQHRTAGIALTSDTLGSTDVGGMRFRVRNCNAGLVDSVDKDLEDMFLPGGISALEGKPYDKNSQHIFADHYFLLPAGCYDVIAQPLKANGQRSADCDRARKNDVDVEDGETTEIMLISQCKGPENGGLDVMGSINHPPEIKSLEFRDSKFLNSCRRGRSDVCATVKDPDGDPLQFRWVSTRRGTHKASIVQTTRTRLNDTEWRVCAKMATAPKGKYAWRLRAFDTLADGRRIQNVIRNSDQYGKCQANNTNCSSNDQINAWFYAQVDCRARSAAILQAMSEVPFNRGKAFVKQTTDWANHLVRKGGVEPQILYMLDDNNQGEHGVDGLGNGPDGDAEYVVKALRTEFGAANVTLKDEPAGGAKLSTFRNYDIVWFANPGHELDDATTRNRLRRARNRFGISVIVQGDDMAGGDGSGPNMRSLTNLNLVSNGTTTCGQTTDNNAGVRYRMQFTNEPITALNGIIRDLRGRTYRYGEDVDHTNRLGQGEQILLQARRPANAQCPNGFQTPAAVALDPINLP